MTRTTRTSVLFTLFIFIFRPAAAMSSFAAGLLQQSETRAGLVVVHDNGEVVTRCVDLAQPSVTGLQVLEWSGLDLNYDPSNPMGAAICRVDNEGCSYPEDDCFCRCLDVPCFYWSYWFRGESGDWEYSPLGAGNRRLGPGSVDAWVWSDGTPNQDASRRPPDVTFADICPAPTPTASPSPTNAPVTATPVSIVTSTPTATLTPFPTATPSPTVTPSPTMTPLPSATPTPSATPLPDAPAIELFTADRFVVDAGMPVLLTWRVTRADEVFLDTGNGPQLVEHAGSRTVNPVQTTGYVLTARNAAAGSRDDLLINVNAATATPTATPVPVTEIPPTETPLPAPTSTATATTVPPTTTPAPAATPTWTPTWTPTPVVGPIVVVTPLSANNQGLDDDTMTRVLLGGLAFLVGLPFLFAGIFFVFWTVWRRR